MMKKQLWKFTGTNGDFIFPDAEKINQLYFPLANEAEFMSSITPQLKGDIKLGQNHFLMQPVTRECLYNIKSSRNFWLYINKNTVWSITGCTALMHKPEKTLLKAGILWHTITRTSKELGLEAEITNFVPVTADHTEIMRIKITNLTKKTISFTPTSAIPIFGRSADNLRDHRHVTSLLHRIKLTKNGIIVKPVMSFDERGHRINHFSYFVLGCEQNSRAPQGYFPTIESFIGPGGCLERPQAIIKNLMPLKKISRIHQGKEAIGALRFQAKTLAPKQSATYILMLGIAEKPQQIAQIFKKFNHPSKIASALSENKNFWKKKVEMISFQSKENNFDNWLRWVTLQPVLRKIFGCSFLPDFDYGRGGKGWRDLWQDTLTLLFIHPKKIKHTLSINFSGIRIDGTNATIITKKPGHFIADRNKIPRVWMDHGVWPYFTLQLYIHQTGDFNILFENHTYFYDQQISRGTSTNYLWNQDCKHLRTKQGNIYKGTILEHILIQHLSAFFNVGKNNNIKLESADWNDGLDMAKEHGESVAFTCFYAWNLRNMTILLKELKKHFPKRNINLAKEILILLDTLGKTSINYNSADKKNALLTRYFNAVKTQINGKKVSISIDALINDLSKKWQWSYEQIRKNEWLDINKKIGFFNGYYDNQGKQIEGKINNTIRMTLTGQVFPLMSGIASKEQTAKIIRSVNKYLNDKKLSGLRLNTDFKSPQFHLGRAFAFSYGSKENGAIFSHMCVMFAYALYQQGSAEEGFKILQSLFNLAQDTEKSKIFPCLPEYFDLAGQGMYSYLTGSASWYIMTVLTEVFGIKGYFGDLVIEPKLVSAQFKNSTTISAQCYFAEKRITVKFYNPEKLKFNKYQIANVKIEPSEITFKTISSNKILIPRKEITNLPDKIQIKIRISLKK